MHDCCIRVTVLLECFEKFELNKPSNKPHNRTGAGRGSGVNHAINTKWLGIDYWCYKFLLCKRRVPSYSIIIVIEKGCGHCASTFKTNE